MCFSSAPKHERLTLRIQRLATALAVTTVVNSPPATAMVVK